MAKKKNDDGSSQVVVHGKIMWAHLDKENEMSGKYQLDICQLDDADAKLLEAAGLDVKEGGEKKPTHGRYVTPKATRQVTVVDANKDAWDDLGNIGNETEAKVCIRAYDYNYNGKKGVAAGLQAVQVLNHVKYDPAGAFNVETDYAPEPAKDDVPF